MNISVIVPTYKRSELLKQCLVALTKQNRLPEEVLLIIHPEDKATTDFLENFRPENLNLRILTINVIGSIPAYNLGLSQAKGQIIVFTDDDASASLSWLEKIEAHFLSEPKLGGLGGRDNMFKDGKLIEGRKETVGKLQWFGRMIGNHHLGFGGPRLVDHLKGVNMSFRREAIDGLCFEKSLRGSGTIMFFELDFSLKVKQRNWQIIYDPNIIVDHYLGERPGLDKRDEFNPAVFTDNVYNETLIVLKHLSPMSRCFFIVWCLAVGTRDAPGFVQLLRFLPSQRGLILRKLLASYRGRWQGFKAWKKLNYKK